MSAEPPLKKRRRREMVESSTQSGVSSLPGDEIIAVSSDKHGKGLISATDVLCVSDGSGDLSSLILSAKFEAKIGRHRNVDTKPLIGQPYGVSMTVHRTSDLARKLESGEIPSEGILAHSDVLLTKEPWSIVIRKGIEFRLHSEQSLVDEQTGFSVIESTKSDDTDTDTTDSSTTTDTTTATTTTTTTDPIHRDNRNVFDLNTAQKYREQEVRKMAEEMGGEELVSRLVAGSDSYRRKNELTQRKYVTKKRMKHANTYVVLPMTAVRACQVYFSGKASKSLALRPDSMSQIIHFSGAYSSDDQSVLCVDETHGIITAALCERMDGRGRILVPYFGSHPTLHVTYELCQLTEQQKSNIYSFDCSLWKCDDQFSESEHVEMTRLSDPSSMPKEYRKLRPTLATVRGWLLKEQCDSLIVATAHECISVFSHAWKCLALGKPFVMWSQHIEECTAVKCWLDERREKGLDCAVLLRCHDNWLRQWQVLPMRTHPVVNMHHLGGYLLTGYKCGPLPVVSMED